MMHDMAATTPRGNKFLRQRYCLTFKNTYLNTLPTPQCPFIHNRPHTNQMIQMSIN